MTIQQIQEKIAVLKREKDVTILAHSYQSRAVTEVADVVGDSYALSAKAAECNTANALMCGVRFMAETVKILSPKKRVYLSEANAGCPMAEQLDMGLFAQLTHAFPGYTVVAYINTTAELKTKADVCVTSSSAVKIVNALPEKDIVFVPDANLGDFVKKNCPDKNVKTFYGGCPIHNRVMISDLEAAKIQYPDALVLVHPECDMDLQRAADYVGSTSGIMEYAKKSPHKEFIIGTEISIAEHLQYDCPGKRFYPLDKNLICPNMRLTNLVSVLDALESIGSDNNAREVTLTDDTIAAARRSIDRMLELGR